jgi:hypothetical protein
MMKPGQMIRETAGSMVPARRPAMAVMILKVEPGGYWPWMARFSQPPDASMALADSWESRGTKLLRS